MKRAFTLIELLIVVIIVGILATVALPQYTKVVEKARWTEAASMLGSIRKAALIYYAEHGDYFSDRPGTSEYYLNGPDVDDVLDGPVIRVLTIDVPEPRNGRYCYTVYDKLGVASTSGRCADAFWDKDDDGWTAGDPLLVIYYDGRFYNTNGAPEF